jgi:hypothetical protein
LGLDTSKKRYFSISAELFPIGRLESGLRGKVLKAELGYGGESACRVTLRSATKAAVASYFGRLTATPVMIGDFLIRNIK